MVHFKKAMLSLLIFMSSCHLFRIINMELDNIKKIWNSREMILFIFTISQKLIQIHSLSLSLLLVFQGIPRNSQQDFMGFFIPQNS